MDTLLLASAALIGVTAGPIIVARLLPNQISGDVTAGESGASSMFWGVPLGLTFFYLVLTVFILNSSAELASLPTKFGLIAILFTALTLVCAPSLICGFHKWRWDSNGVEFIGVFRRQSVLWQSVTSIHRMARTGWTLRTSDNSKLSITNYVPGQRLIMHALLASRPDLAKSVSSAIENERPW